MDTFDGIAAGRTANFVNSGHSVLPELRLGDCLDAAGLPSLPDRCVDVTIADPPFDGRTHRAALEIGDWRQGSRTVSAPLPFAPLDDSTLELVAAHLARITCRWIVVFAGEVHLDKWRRALEAGGARFV